MFSTLFGNVWQTFATVTSGLANGIKEAFAGLIYKVTGSAGAPDVGGFDILIDKSTISPLASFLFAIGGFGLAIGIIYGIFRLIRGVAHR